MKYAFEKAKLSMLKFRPKTVCAGKLCWGGGREAAGKKNFLAELNFTNNAAAA